jgi:hypothetical protein
MQRIRAARFLTAVSLVLACAAFLPAQDTGAQPKKKAAKKQKSEAEVIYPPKLPGGQPVVTDRSDAFLKPAETLREGVAVARTPPTVDFLYYPGQNYPGKPWSNWGDSLAVGGKYYASIGDHLAPAGNAFVFEYDPEKKTLRQLVDIRKVLNLPDGHYTPGKIHGRLDLGSDGWLYFSTHRGSPKVTNDQFHYKGDWIFRCNPATAETEIIVQGPVPKHCIPNSVLDSKRLIFYGGTAQGSGSEDEGIQFLAYDVKARKLLYSGPDGPSRYMALATSTGKLYYTQGKQDGTLMRFDPAVGKPVPIPGTIGIRAATQETQQGIIYTVSQGQRGAEPILYALNTKTEAIEPLGPAPVGKQSYIASLDADPTGRYLYYVAGAHGGSDQDGTPVVQFDTRTKQKKVIAFLHPFYQEKYGAALRGTYSTAVDPKGDKLYITWNVSRGSRAWDCCALTVLHLPESERRP